MPTTLQPVIVTPSMALLLAFYKALLGAVEEGQIALGEGDEPAGAGADGGGGQFGVGKQRLSFGMVENVHGGLRKCTAAQHSQFGSCRLGVNRTVELR